MEPRANSRKGKGRLHHGSVSEIVMRLGGGLIWMREESGKCLQFTFLLKQIAQPVCSLELPAGLGG